MTRVVALHEQPTALRRYVTHSTYVGGHGWPTAGGGFNQGHRRSLVV